MEPLTWNTKEEAMALVGKRVRITDNHLKHCRMCANLTGVYAIRDVVGLAVTIGIPDFSDTLYRSGDLLLAEPEAAPLPLDKIAVRVETESESRQIQGRFFALGWTWPTTCKDAREVSRGITMGYIKAHSGYALAEKTIGWSPGPEEPRNVTVLSASSFLAAYPVPVSTPKPEAKPEPVPAWTNSDGGAFALKIAEPPPWTCPHCGREYPGRTGKIRFCDKERETTSCTPCFVALLENAGWIKPLRKQTRLEALMDLAASGLGPRPSEICHKGYTRGGDKA